jgi:rfaE bifunctional protein nucleotidyltransferase chain/domain
MLQERVITPSALGILREKLHDRKIVLATGCFDIIHSGHLYFIKEARSKGDGLVVGLNSDKSIKGIKGPDRPITHEQERCEIMSALRDVDYVFIFDSKVVTESMLKLKPDIFAIGAEAVSDYPEEVEAARKIGATIYIVERTPSNSTTSIINSISKR